MNYPLKSFGSVFLACVLIISPLGAHAVTSTSTATEQARLMALIKTLQAQLAALKQAESTGLPAKPTTPALASFPSAGTTWKDKFHKSSDIPTDAYRAYYFDTTRTSTVAKQETVHSVDVNYAWSAGPGFTINSQNFGGYWIGKFTTTSTKTMVLKISQSWSETRIIIDGREVYKGGQSSTTTFTLPKGTHTIEVEYVNNWHTTSFSVSLHDKATEPEVISGSLKLDASISDVWYAGVYESNAFDQSITLTSKSNSKTAKALVLSSYDAVKWDLTALSGQKIPVIVISSYSPGSEVRNAPDGSKVYTASIPYAYQTKAQCYYTSSTFFHCDGLRDFSNAYHKVKGLLGKPLTGFVGSYGATTLSLPGTVLTDSVAKELLNYPAVVEAEAKKKQKSQTIDSIF